MFNFPDQALMILKRNVMKYVISLKYEGNGVLVWIVMCVVRDSHRQQSTMVSSETNWKTTRYEQEKEKHSN